MVFHREFSTGYWIIAKTFTQYFFYFLYYHITRLPPYISFFLLYRVTHWQVEWFSFYFSIIEYSISAWVIFDASPTPVLKSIHSVFFSFYFTHFVCSSFILLYYIDNSPRFYEFFYYSVISLTTQSHYTFFQT